MEIRIQPTEADDLNGVDTTRLEITVDVTSVMHLMKTYDLLLKTTLHVEVYGEAGETKQMRYEFAQLYGALYQPYIVYEAIVVGHITEVSQIQGHAEGTMVLRALEGGK